MNKKKLDPKHVYLQYLMMFSSLVAILLFSLFLKDLLWFNNATTTLPLISGVIGIILSFPTLLIHLKQKNLTKKKQTQEKTFLLLAVFFFLLGALTIFTTVTGTISYSTQVSISTTLILLLLALFIFFFLRKNWIYSDLDFWIIFSLSLFIFARLFFLSAILRTNQGVEEYSHLITLFGYVALGIGVVNEYWQLMKGKK